MLMAFLKARAHSSFSDAFLTCNLSLTFLLCCGFFCLFLAKKISPPNDNLYFNKCRVDVGSDLLVILGDLNMTSFDFSFAVKQRP